MLEGRDFFPACGKCTLVWMTDGCASLEGVRAALAKYSPFGENLTAFFMFFGTQSSGEETVKRVCAEFQSVCKGSSGSFAKAVDASKLKELFCTIARRGGNKLSFA